LTIAAGFLCKDGIVMCADSQETAGDYKFPLEKLVSGVDSWTEVVIAGSGIGHLVDAAARRITRHIMGGYESYEVIEDRIREALNELYKNDFRLYPSQYTGDTIVDLLIGVKLRKAQYPVLFAASATAVSRVAEYAVIGSGRAVQYTIQSLYGKYMPLSRGVLIAIYLMNTAKSVLTTVGGQSKIATIHNGDAALGFAGPLEIKEAEDVFKRFNTQLSLVIDLANLEKPEEEFQERIADFTRYIAELRQNYRANIDRWRNLMELLSRPLPPRTEPAEENPTAAQQTDSSQ